MSEWRPIETAPKRTGVLLAYHTGGVAGVMTGMYCDFDHAPHGWYEGGRHLTSFVPTHWMPLPAPPVHGGER